MSLATRRLGASGFDVSVLALGTMMFGSWGNTDVGECRRMVDRALDGGINLIDTADIYGEGGSEEILGAALRGRRDRVVLATKCGNPMGDDPTQRGLSARWVRQACDDSLRRLAVDHIDLFQMHRPDPTVALAETLGAFDELVRAGKVRAVGTSTLPPALIDEAQRVAAAEGLVVPCAEQPPYSVLARGIEADVLPTCRRAEIGVLVWAPLNGGWLTGKYQRSSGEESSRANRKGEHFDHRDEDVRRRKVELVDRLAAIAADCGLTLVQLAVAFVLDEPAVSAALLGPRTVAQLDDLLAAGAPALPAGARVAIDAVVAPGTNVNPNDAI